MELREELEAAHALARSLRKREARIARFNRAAVLAARGAAPRPELHQVRPALQCTGTWELWRTGRMPLSRLQARPRVPAPALCAERGAAALPDLSPFAAFPPWSGAAGLSRERDACAGAAAPPGFRGTADLSWHVVHALSPTVLLSSATRCAGMRAQEHILLHNKLGEGTYGCVHEASLAEAGPFFAVKLLKLDDDADEADGLEAVADMEAEASVQCALGGHPCIVQARRARASAASPRGRRASHVLVGFFCLCAGCG